MCEAFTQLSQKFSELYSLFQHSSFSKFSSILKEPTMNLLMSTLKCDCHSLEDIMELYFQIDKMKDFNQAQELSKIEKLNIKKNKFYELLSTVVTTKTKKYIASIIPLIKQKLTEILEIYKRSHQEKEETEKKLLQVEKKLDHLILMAMNKIKSACQKLQQLIIGTQKLKKWNCECTKPKCRNRYIKGYIWQYIFKNIILPNELLKTSSIQSNFQQLMHVEIQNTQVKKLQDNSNLFIKQQDIPFCKNQDFSVFQQQKQKLVEPCSLAQKKCQEQKSNQNQLPKQKKKKKKKKKGTTKNNQKITNQQKDLDEIQTNQSTQVRGENFQKSIIQQKFDPEFQLIYKNLQQLQIDDKKRLDCHIESKFLLKWSNRAQKQNSNQNNEIKMKKIKKYCKFDYMEQ